MLVGGAISIRDPYICAIHESLPTNRTLSSTGPLSVQCKRNYSRSLFHGKKTVPRVNKTKKCKVGKCG